MKILLIGKTGQVGGELRRTLAGLGSVTAVGREEIDLGLPDSIRACIRNHEPGLIVNAAAYTAVDQAESEPELALAVNGAAPGILAEEAGQLGILLVHYSTDYVFDGAKEGPYTEQDRPNPNSIYGKTKLAGDEAIRAVGCAHLIFRTSWVYGNRGKNFLLTMLRLAREKETLPVVDDQIGAPTWSRMIAETTTQVLGQMPAPTNTKDFAEVSGIYHLTAAGQTSWFGFAKAILKNDPRKEDHLLREVRPISTAEYPTAAKRPANSVLDTDKLRQRFGIELPHWEESLKLVLGV